MADRHQSAECAPQTPGAGAGGGTARGRQSCSHSVVVCFPEQGFPSPVLKEESSSRRRRRLRGSEQPGPGSGLSPLAQLCRFRASAPLPCPRALGGSIHT